MKRKKKVVKKNVSKKKSTKATKKPAVKKKPAKAKKAAKKVAKKAVKKISKKKVAKKAAPKKAVKKAAKVAKKPATKKQPVAKKAATTKKPAPQKAVAAKAPNAWLGKALPTLDVQVVKGGTPTQTSKLTDLVGSGVSVLYFYPKDDTPGCTIEACEFGDRLPDFVGLGATVVGVSPDDEASHLKFIEKFNIPFQLIADTSKELANKLGVWKEKNFMGKNYMGVERATFLLKDGFVVHAWQPVSVEGHVAAVHQKITELKG